MKKFLIGLMVTVLGIVGVMVASENKVYAEGSCGGVETAIIDCDEGEGDGIKGVLKLVVDIMTMGIGILGVFGIVLVGIQYLTAGGNEAQMTKAKRRMMEIVIGLAIYAAIYAIVTFLLPDSEDAFNEVSVLEFITKNIFV